MDFADDGGEGGKGFAQVFGENLRREVMTSGFISPFSQKEGLRRTLEFELVHPKPDEIEFLLE